MNEFSGQNHPPVPGEGEGEKEYWGDDELIARDLSGTMLLSRADLTRFFNQKGYPGTYPALLFFSDDAERLNDLIFSEIARSQSPDASPRFVIDAETKFEGREEASFGRITVRMSGDGGLDASVREEIILLMLDGIRSWLEEAYSTHGRIARLSWTKTGPEAEGLITSNG